MDTLKILVVDDEARMRKLVKDFLTNKGFAVIEAGDGEEAVDVFFAQKDIALVLLDVICLLYTSLPGDSSRQPGFW